jgi:hypothetical protein
MFACPAPARDRRAILLGYRRSAKRRNLPLSISLHCRMCVSNLLSMKSFHEVLAGNVYECLLKSSIGKASIFSLKHYWRFVDSEPLELKALSQGMAEKAA